MARLQLGRMAIDSHEEGTGAMPETGGLAGPCLPSRSVWV